jgi:uncharacterized protein YbjT (DUF2867 family)
MSRLIAVAGATGALGRHIVATLVHRGHKVLAMGRDQERLARMASPRVRPVTIDLLSAHSIEGHLLGVERVISCLGASVSPSFGAGWGSYSSVDVPANRRLANEAERAGVGRFVYVSVAPGQGEEPSKLAYYRAHEAVVAHLQSKRFSTAVVRPTGFFSAHGEYLALARRGYIPLLGDGSARSNPIADEEVALACVEASEGELADRSIGGPEVLSRRAIGELAFQALGRPARFVSAPSAAISLGALALKPLSPRLSELLPFLAYVSTHDVIAPAAGTQRLADHFARLARAAG